MIIANPIYDVVFKSLMQNARIARFFIETLIEETLDDVALKPQEFVYTTEQKILAVSRYDFIATIKTASGEHKKVLIEIQKAKNAIDLMRFRNYLGEQYKKEDEIPTEYGLQKRPLPIIAIYLLGFSLPGIESAAVKVARNYTDLLTHEIISQKSDFIERLSHDCYVVQMSKIQTRVRSSLEELLSVFEQNNFVDENGIIKEFNHEVKNEVVKSIVNMLNYVGTDPVRKKEIEIEQEAWRTIAALSGEIVEELKWKIEQKEKTIVEKDKALDEKDKALDEKDKALDEKDKALYEKENVLAEKEKALADERNAREALSRELSELRRKLGNK